jgi:hypothetical protein
MGYMIAILTTTKHNLKHLETCIHAPTTDVAERVATDPRIVVGYAGLGGHAANTADHNTSSNELTPGAMPTALASYDGTKTTKSFATTLDGVI